MKLRRADLRRIGGGAACIIRACLLKEVEQRIVIEQGPVLLGFSAADCAPKSDQPLPLRRLAVGAGLKRVIMTLRLRRDWPLCHRIGYGLIKRGDVALAIKQCTPGGVTTPRSTADRDC